MSLSLQNDSTCQNYLKLRGKGFLREEEEEEPGGCQSDLFRASAALHEVVLGFGEMAGLHLDWMVVVGRLVAGTGHLVYPFPVCSERKLEMWSPAVHSGCKVPDFVNENLDIIQAG